MQILPLSNEVLANAIVILHGGGTVVYPTETAYALGADPFQLKGVASVFALKGRDTHKPLGLIAGSVEQVETLCEVHPDERALFRYWPGALSFVLPFRNNLSTEWLKGLVLATAAGDRVSVRVSSHPVARKLAELLGHPIIATSANRSGDAEIYDAQTLRKVFKCSPQPNLVIAAGTLPIVKPSTVVIFRDHKPVVVRQGPVIIQNEE